MENKEQVKEKKEGPYSWSNIKSFCKDFWWQCILMLLSLVLYACWFH